jgi:hypothetical protein
VVLGRASGAVLAWSKKERRGREWAGREEVSWPGQVCGVRIQAFSCQAKRWPVTEGNRGDQCVVVTQCGGHTGCVTQGASHSVVVTQGATAHDLGLVVCMCLEKEASAV